MKQPENRPSIPVSAKTLLTFSVICAFAGCASVDNVLRMPPTTQISAANINTPSPQAKITTSSLPGKMVLYNVDAKGKLTQVADVSGLNPELYVTVDVSGVLQDALAGKIKDADRNNIIGFLICLSDRNADVWESRVWAMNKFRKTAIGTTRDLATAGAGVSSLIVPPVSAGLSAFNLLAGRPRTRSTRPFTPAIRLKLC